MQSSLVVYRLRYEAGDLGTPARRRTGWLRHGTCCVGRHWIRYRLRLEVGIGIMLHRPRGEPLPHMSEGLPHPVFEKRRENVCCLLIESPKFRVMEKPVMDFSMVSYSPVPFGRYCSDKIHPSGNKAPGCAETSRNGPGRE